MTCNNWRKASQIWSFLMSH